MLPITHISLYVSPILFPVKYRKVQHTPKKHSSKLLFVTKVPMIATRTSKARNSPNIIRITFFTICQIAVSFFFLNPFVIGLTDIQSPN